MNPILVGYFPKRTERHPDWLKAPAVEEICSVSECISEGPDGWVNHWRHNKLWLYDSPELAWSVIPPETRETFDLYAYALFPVRFVCGREEPFDVPTLTVEPLSPCFVRLGFDAVSRSMGESFECSPLSCNGMAEDAPVNRYCLFDSKEEAFEHARRFSVGRCEPGPYHVLEVWRHQPEQHTD